MARFPAPSRFLTIIGFLALVFACIGRDTGLISASLSFILVLVLSLVQSVIAIAALLFSADILKLPPPGQKQPPQLHYGYYGQSYSQQQPPHYGGGPAGPDYQGPLQPQPPQQPGQPGPPGQHQPQQQQW